jgi:hypothetical protein
MGDFKGIRPSPGAKIELYDLNLDLGETNNIAENHPQVVSRIERAMQEAFVASPAYPIVSPKRPER